MGEALQGRIPEGVHVTSKILLGRNHPAKPRQGAPIHRPLARRAKARSNRLVFLHSNIIPNDYQFPGELAEDQHRWSVTEACFNEAVVPAFETIQREGLIGAWGITGTGLPSTIIDVLKGEAKPQAVQVIANLLDSPGAIKRFPEAAEPRNIIRTATESGVGVLGIRAVQAGALTRLSTAPYPKTTPKCSTTIAPRPSERSARHGILILQMLLISTRSRWTVLIPSSWASRTEKNCSIRSRPRSNRLRRAD